MSPRQQNVKEGTLLQRSELGRRELQDASGELRSGDEQLASCGRCLLLLFLRCRVEAERQTSALALGLGLLVTSLSLSNEIFLNRCAFCHTIDCAAIE